MSYNLSQIAEVVGAQLRGGRLATATTQPRVSALLTDSRSLSVAEQTLFFALVTSHADGHHYVGSLYNQGVRAFVVTDCEELRRTCPEAWFLVVGDTLTALQDLAAWHRSHFDMPVVGITGSNGKTVVKEWLYQMLHDVHRVTRSPRSFNSQIGVPLSVWQIDAATDIALIEAGISQMGEMDRLERIIRPTIGILTGIGAAHDAGFANRQQKLLEKLRLFRDCEVIIYNADIEGINEALEIAGIGARSMAWTRRRMGAQIEVMNVERSDNATTVYYTILGFDGTFTIPMTDDASVENAMNCLALMIYLGLKPEEIEERMKRLLPLAMRLEVVEGQHTCQIINDAYSADLTSLEVALAFQRRRVQAGQSQVLILSDMVETGVSADERMMRVANLCRTYGIGKYIGVGPQSVLAAHSFASAADAAPVAIASSVYESTDDLIASGELDSLHDALILLKGARSFHFERLASILQLRQHETVLEVNLDAVIHNLNVYRSRLRPDTRLVCMVKAFGYGTGSYELAKTLQDQRVDYLAVAVADEGVELRRQGIQTPIIVMNPEMSTFRTMIEHRLEPEVYSFRLLDAFVDECSREGVVGYPIHVKIDSGMHRLGFQADEMDTLVVRLKNTTAVRVSSVFSHFAGADSTEFDDFTAEQVRRFTACADCLREALPDHPIRRHILNSAGIERFPQWQFEMCRLGIGLYGYEASNEKLGLEPVATLRSTILQIKTITPPETVGYSRRGRLSRPTRIAMVPIGYADGYDRRLGNGHAFMAVDGVRCPTVGNVCMDVTFLDVTDCPTAGEGSKVEVFGHDVPVTELADILGTITYEIISTVNTRVGRVYYKE